MPIADGHSQILTVVAESFSQWANFESAKVGKLEEYFSVYNSYFAKEGDQLKGMIKDWDSHWKRDLKDEAKGKPATSFYPMLNYLCEQEIERVTRANIKESLGWFLDFSLKQREITHSMKLLWSNSVEKFTHLAARHGIDPTKLPASNRT